MSGWTEQELIYEAAFAGSGTTLEAARNTGHKSIGIEAEETYLPLIDQRLQRSNTNPIELEGIGE